MERTDVNRVLHDVLFLLRKELHSRGLQVATDTPPDALFVLGDRTQLQQVLLNLIMNSAEAMHPDEAAVVTVRCERTKDRNIEISVSDTGQGIAPDRLDHIFEAFYTTKVDGIGMGLSICRSIVEAHGGRDLGYEQLPFGRVIYLHAVRIRGDSC